MKFERRKKKEAGKEEKVKRNSIENVIKKRLKSKNKHREKKKRKRKRFAKQKKIMKKKS